MIYGENFSLKQKNYLGLEFIYGTGSLMTLESMCKLL